MPTSAIMHSNGDCTTSELFSFDVEQMRHIPRYLITLKPNEDWIEPCSPPDLEVGLGNTQGNQTTIVVKSKKNATVVVKFSLPRVSNPEFSGIVTGDDGSLQFSLSYEGEPSIRCVGPAEPNVEEINEMACRFCDQPILQEKSISRLLPLPAGHWEEIVDYLICYSGQPVIDLAPSSTSAQPGVAMQDLNIVCLHRDDVGNGVCILATDGYGQPTESVTNNGKVEQKQPSLMDEVNDLPATVRGSRLWRDVVGGATICCSLCCSTLGYASIKSPLTYRLFKHRLQVSKRNNKKLQQSALLTTTASFVAREMVRYAESKAIFTFVVGIDNSHGMNLHGRRKCLLLRLVSWDTALATANYSSVPATANPLKFETIAKVVYEVAFDKYSQGNGDQTSPWMWGGLDLCCIPNNENVNSNSYTKLDDQGRYSSVRIELPYDEWEEVRQSLLDGSKRFSSSVASATIIAKLGKTQNQNDGAVGLSAISLTA